MNKPKKQLYRVTVEHTFFMVSEGDELDVLDAESCAREALREDIPDLITDSEVTSLEEIPKEYRNTYPYGEGGNVRTCDEWLKFTA